VRIATWNVNSLKIRLPQLLDWLAQAQPDVVCLQETKLEDAQFPAGELAAAGYQAVFSGQKTYNGVAILSRAEATDVAFGLDGFADEQKRVIAATVGDVRVVCFYVPNGQAVGSEKYEYKLAWLAAAERHLAAELARHPRLAVGGDYNIAPEDRDVHDPELWRDQVLCSQPERAAFGRLLGVGLADGFRLFEQPERSFSWWDYRQLGFQKNRGLRIDHILVSAELAARAGSCRIDRAMRKRERPSDHAPVVLELREATDSAAPRDAA
jgi:exodeoxyribonuclease-3